MSKRLSARTTWSMGQRLLLAALAVAAVAGAILAPKPTLLALDLFLFGGFALVVGVKLLSIVAGLLLHDIEDATVAELAALTDDELPMYTILVPMYKEPGMVGHMVKGLKALDYPKHKLDVQLLLEEDDKETQLAAAELNLPDWVSVVVAPDGKPKTKPRACNIGLERARGEFLVIFDAEDRPDSNQLKKAVATFRRLPDTTCLQACLNYYNARQNLLTRWFTLEYTTWFDLFLPGLHSLGAPIPLGGTSNHFRTETLRELGGWDAWNVTEDCDLGLHMAREGLETRVLNSTTWEEAVSQVPVWLGQRSRWVKGYWQTLLVHTRQPLRAMREFGPWKYLMMWLVVGGHVFALTLQPFCWIMLAIGMLRGESIFHPSAPHTVYLYVAAMMLGACNLLFVLVHAIAVWQRQLKWLWPAALGLPIYWTLMSVAAWKGVLQHLWAPFRWEKTTHGLVDAANETVMPPPLPLTHRRTANRFVSLAVITLAVGAIVLVAAALPLVLNFERDIREATLSHDLPVAEVDLALEQNWQHSESVSFRLRLEEGLWPDDNAVFKAIVHFKDGDERWFQQQTSDCVRDGRDLLVTADLQQPWRPTGTPSGQAFGPWNLRRVRSAGLKLYAITDGLQSVRYTDLKLQPQEVAEPVLAASWLHAPTAGKQNEMLEFRFQLSRDYKNPFDPRQVDANIEFRAPNGAMQRAVAFYFQEYDPHYEGRREVLTPRGTPEWRVRYTPRLAGTYSWRLVVTDHQGDHLQTPWQEVSATAGDAPGFIRVDPDDHRFFAYENGDFFFPLGVNLRSPTDTAQPKDRDYRMPSPAGGAKVMNEYVDQMAASGMNLARIWMSPWFGGIEWHKSVPGYHGIGQYNLRHARQLDWILNRARSHGIVVDLALQNHGPFASTYDLQWEENPYNAKHGGPLRDRRHVMTHPEAKRLFAQRFRYIAARWGADPAIFGWTAWIEVDAVRAKYSDVRDWHRKMLPVLRQYDTGRHPISTMFAGNWGDRAIWDMDEIDFTQIAAYSEYVGAVDRFEEVADYLARFRKPAIIEEYGGSARANSMALMAQHVHDGLWAGLMQDLAGAPYPWWWNLIFAKDLDRFHATAAKFVGDADLRGKRWRCENVSLRRGRGMELRAAYRQSDDLIWAWIYEDEQTNLRARRGEAGNGMDWERISVVHQRAYQRLVGDRYDPLSATEPDRFPAVRGTILNLSGAKPGSYQVEFWETWGNNRVSMTTVEVEESGQLVVPLPTLTRDLAVRIVRQTE